MNKQEYREHIANFCVRNNGKREFRGYTIYNSARSLLVERVCGERVNEHDITGIGLKAVLLDKSNIEEVKEKVGYVEGLPCGVDIKLKEDLEEKNADEEKNNFGFNNNFIFRKGTSRIVDFAGLRLKKDKIEGQLTYDGICAFAALAPKEALVKNGQTLNDEIVRCAKKEMLAVDESRACGAREISLIGEKYLELQCVVGEVLGMAKQEIREEARAEYERKCDEEDRQANAAEAYSESLAKLEMAQGQQIGQYDASLEETSCEQ